MLAQRPSAGVPDRRRSGIGIAAHVQGAFQKKKKEKKRKLSIKENADDLLHHQRSFHSSNCSDVMKRNENASEGDSDESANKEEEQNESSAKYRALATEK